jgi:mannosyltransferase
MHSPDPAVTENLPQSESIPRQHDFADKLILGFLVMVGAVLRFSFLTRKSFWFDEGVSVEIARLDWYNFARLLWRREANMSLYYLMLRGWLHLGHSEFFIRSLSVITAIATIPLLYILGRRMFDRWVGLIAALLLTINAFHIGYSQEARSYTLFVLLSTLSAFYFVRSIHDPSPKNLRIHIAVSVLAVYAHFFAVLLIVTEWLSLSIHEPREVRLALRTNWRWIAALAAPVLIFVAVTGAGPLAWVPRPGLYDLYTLSLWLCGDGGPVLLLAYGLSCLPALIAAIGHDAPKPRADWDQWRHRFLFLWLAFPLAFIFLVSQIRPLFLDRYFLFLVPALALTAAAGLVRLRSRRLTTLGVALLVVFSLFGLRNYYQRDFDLEHEDWRSATHYVLEHAQPGDALIFHTGMGRMPFEYYRWDAPGPVVLYPHHDDKITFQDFFGRPDEGFLNAVPVRYPRVWVVFSHNQGKLGQESDAVTKRITQIFASGYTQFQVQSFAGVKVYLYSGMGAAADHGTPRNPASRTSDAVPVPR